MNKNAQDTPTSATLPRNHEQSENRDQTGSHAFPPAVPPPLCDQLSGQTGDAEGKWKRWEAGSTESQGKETEQGQPPRLCGSHSPPLGPKSSQGPAWRTMASGGRSQAPVDGRTLCTGDPPIPVLPPEQIWGHLYHMGSKSAIPRERPLT